MAQTVWPAIMKLNFLFLLGSAKFSCGQIAWITNSSCSWYDFRFWYLARSNDKFGFSVLKRQHGLHVQPQILSSASDIKSRSPKNHKIFYAMRNNNRLVSVYLFYFLAFCWSSPRHLLHYHCQWTHTRHLKSKRFCQERRQSATEADGNIWIRHRRRNYSSLYTISSQPLLITFPIPPRLLTLHSLPVLLHSWYGIGPGPPYSVYRVSSPGEIFKGTYLMWDLVWLCRMAGTRWQGLADPGLS